MQWMNMVVTYSKTTEEYSMKTCIFLFFAQLSVLSVPITIKIHYVPTKIYLSSFQIANPGLPSFKLNDACIFLLLIFTSWPPYSSVGGNVFHS